MVDPVKMHPYRAQATMQQIGAQRNSPHKWAFPSLSKLGALARAMGYLVSIPYDVRLVLPNKSCARLDGSQHRHVSQLPAGDFS